MRDVTIGETKIKVRGLTIKEIKKLKEEGQALTIMGPDVRKMAIDLDLAEKTMNRVLEITIPPEKITELEDQPATETHKVWRAVLDETYGSETEEKNS